MAELSAYELERLENIRRNEDQLAQLGLGGGIVPVLPKTAARRPQKRAISMPSAAPERRSVRNQGAKAPGFYVEHELSRGGIRVGGDAQALSKEAEEDKERAAKAKKAADPLIRFSNDVYPEDEEHLLAGEKYAFRALRDARRATSKELQLEGYKIAHNRSLCEMVRRLPTSAEELSECWGFGGSGKRVRDFGELFLSVLAPRVKKLREVHEAARQAWETHEEEVAVEEPVEAAEAAEMVELMPEKPADLIEAEVAAYAAMVDATHVRAEEIGEKYVWNIALSRSLCEMVRRCPRSMEELRACWGFGGAGLKAQKHGAFLLAALAPRIPSIEAAHATLRARGAVGAEGKGGTPGLVPASTDAAAEAEAEIEAMAEVRLETMVETTVEASPQILAGASQVQSGGRTGGKRKATEGKASGTDVEAAPRRRTRLSSGRATVV